MYDCNIVPSKAVYDSEIIQKETEVGILEFQELRVVKTKQKTRINYFQYFQIQNVCI